MSATFFLRGAHQLITLRGPNQIRRGPELTNLAIIPDGSLLIRDGRILSLGPTRRIENLKEAQNAIQIPAHGKIVLPGFVDTSLHLSLSRGSPSSRPRRTTDFFDDSVALFRSCLYHGTVITHVHASAEASATQSDIALLRKLTHVGNNLVRVVRSWRIDAHPPEDFATTLQTVLKRQFLDTLAITVNSTHPPPHWAALQPLRASQLPIHLLWNTSSESLLREALGQLEPHLVCPYHPLTEAECEILLAHNVITALNAGRQLIETPTTAAARTLIDGGAAVVLTAGYHCTLAPAFNMQTAIALAVARLGLTIEEAITASTINAACALGFGHLTGSLEVGKSADIAVLNIPDIHLLPRHFGINNIAMMFRAGNIVLNRTRWKPPNDPADRRVRPKSL